MSHPRGDRAGISRATQAAPVHGSGSDEPLPVRMLHGSDGFRLLTADSDLSRALLPDSGPRGHGRADRAPHDQASSLSATEEGGADMGSLAGKTMIMSGGSRGIGAAIAVRAAQDGANVTLIAKTADPHPRLPGTVHTVGTAIEDAGGRALPVVGDIRDDSVVSEAVERTVHQFGGIDIVVNNASSIDLSPTESIRMSRYDLMQDINTRGAFLLSKQSIPYLRRAVNPHILTMSPPITLEPRWFQSIGVAYTVSKFGMSLLTLGLAEELGADGIAVNSLWPRTTVDTAAIRNVVGPELTHRSRTPAIVADAAHAVLTGSSTDATGRFLIDEDVLLAAGVADFGKYRVGSTEGELQPDFWTDPR